jgi:hypothetical protein
MVFQWKPKIVISKFLDLSTPNVDKVKVMRFLNMLTKDQEVDLRNGPISDKVEAEVVPLWRKRVRTTAKDLHPDLLRLEDKYLDVIQVSKSEYSYKMLLDMYDAYRTEMVVPSYGLEPFEKFVETLPENVWPRSTTEYEREKLLVGVRTDTGSGLPKMGPKRDNLDTAFLYADKIESDVTTPAYSFLPGMRTQIGKTRGIWQDPISEWAAQLRAFKVAISKAVELAKKPAKFIKLHYCTPEEMQKFLFSISADCYCVLDYKQYDRALTAYEIDDFHRYLNGDYAGIDHVIDHMQRGPILMPPDGMPLIRLGGLASGKITTNYFGGAKNAQGGFASWKDQKLDRYIEGCSFNGDDNVWLFSTWITDANLEKFAKYSHPRVLEPDKCWISNSSAWYSKVLYTSEWYCKPGSLVLHSVIHRERELTEEALSKGYVAIGTASKVEWLRGHPDGEYLASEIKKRDKYPIETLDDSILNPAYIHYSKSHSFLEETGQLPDLRALQRGFYASVHG